MGVVVVLHAPPETRDEDTVVAVVPCEDLVTCEWGREEVTWVLPPPAVVVVVVALDVLGAQGTRGGGEAVEVVGMEL